ncbi:hypothetical protein Bhyg_02946 [Pseudolycoriella hygida]|uniref:F-box domain-containing protein n=1 Tax=Pseudolycoriella hygida TaxID=35572 RepID=A0A9Q0S894_9DIPT|nr:hypothetical protein Bhyg_02946 [Pseudolycoriella hygida]
MTEDEEKINSIEMEAPSNSVIMNDDYVLHVVKKLNFNDKLGCRLVSNQFKRVVDSITSQKLIVFDRTPIRNGKFAITDEKYTEADAAYVLDLGRFFSSKFIIRCLASIRKLVINGLDEMKFNINVTYKQLIHLELSNLHISTPTILTSPNLKKLSLSNVSLDSAGRDHFSRLGLNALKSKLQHFRTMDILPFECEMELYRKLHLSGVLNELQTLDCHLMSFKTLIYISKNFPQLKTINARFVTCRDKMIDLMRSGIVELVRMLRSDLKVFFFGIPLNEQTAEMIDKFFCSFAFSLNFLPDTVTVKMNSDWDDFNETYGEHMHLFDGFFKLVDTVFYEDRLNDKSIIDRFTSVRQTYYQFWLDIRHDLPDRFKLHPNITHLCLYSFPDGHYNNDILDMVPIHCKNLVSLDMDNWEADVNYKFLLNLRSIQMIKLRTLFAFDKTLYLDMLRTLTKLSFLEIWYEETDAVTKEQLSAFKHTVEDFINNELKFDDCLFRIQSHHRTSYVGNEKFSFVRIVMKRPSRDCVCNSITASEEDVRKMMWCVGYKRKHPESSFEVDRCDLKYGKGRKEN